MSIRAIFEAAFRTQKGLKFIDAEEENVTESDYIYKRDVFSLLGRERITRKYRLLGVKRGLYTISQADCHAVSLPLGRRLACDLDLRDSVYVYAGKTDIRGILSEITSIMGETESARRVFEDPFAFAQIREYMPSDPRKNVNWKATAKAGELMVNTYASSSALRVRIYLDVSADPGVLFSDSFRELGISMAASLIRSLVKAQRDASLVVNCTAGTAGTAEAAPDSPQTGLPSCVRFASCNSAQKLTAVEEFLTTDFDHASLCPFGEMLQRETGSSGKQAADSGSGLSASDEVFVFLSCADSPSLRAQIHALLGTQRSGVFAVPSRTADRRREEQERNLHILPVCNLS